MDEIDNNCECDDSCWELISFTEIHNVSNNDKVFINCHLNSKCVKFEHDTGSALTCMGESLFNKLNFSGLRLKRAGQRLKVANGKTVDKVQVCKVDMKFRGRQFDQIQLHVVSNPFPVLLGRDWITLIWGKDWASNLMDKAGDICNSPGSCSGVSVLGTQVETRVTGDIKVVCKGNYHAENRAAAKVSEQGRDYVFRLDQDRYQDLPD